MSATEPRRTLMRSIISSSLRFRYLVVAAAVGIMLLGITSLPRMHVDVFPEFAPPRVLIQTAHLGGAAGHAGPGVRHRPRHADRHDVEGPLAHRNVDDGVLDHPRPAAAG